MLFRLENLFPFFLLITDAAFMVINFLLLCCKCIAMDALVTLKVLNAMLIKVKADALALKNLNFVA